MSIKTLSIMTYIIYSQQQLQLKSIARLKQIYSEIACIAEVSDKRCKDSWVTAIASRAPEAIADYQASKIQKVTTATPDEQSKAQAVAPESLSLIYSRNIFLRSRDLLRQRTDSQHHPRR
ncbi:hypothetical protein LC612_35315 [Nostoc sp. CHAB 5834]|nr:hypothetical protein [Nostoc sp. CHAB 5834]